MASHINTLLRSQNFKRVSAENKSALLQLDEAQRALAKALDSQQAAVSELENIQSKVNAFELLASNLSFQTSVSKLAQSVDSLDQVSTTQVPVFKDEQGTHPEEKLLSVESVSLEAGSAANKFNVSFKFSAPVEIVEKTSKALLASFSSIEIPDVQITKKSSGGQTYGDVDECNNTSLTAFTTTALFVKGLTSTAPALGYPLEADKVKFVVYLYFNNILLITDISFNL